MTQTVASVASFTFLAMDSHGIPGPSSAPPVAGEDGAMPMSDENIGDESKNLLWDKMNLDYVKAVEVDSVTRISRCI